MLKENGEKTMLGIWKNPVIYIKETTNLKTFFKGYLKGYCKVGVPVGS